MPKEALNSLHSKIYEVFLRAFMSDKFSASLEDREDIRKVENLYEWDALYFPLKKSNISHIANAFQLEFGPNDFKILQIHNFEQTFEQPDWIMVESKFNLDNAVEHHKNMVTFLKEKIEKFCNSQLDSSNFPKVCHVLVFSATNALFRFQKTVHKFKDWEMFVSIFYLNHGSLFLKYSDINNFNPEALIQNSFEKNKRINNLEVQVVELVEQKQEFERKIAAQKEELKEEFERKTAAQKEELAKLKDIITNVVKNILPKEEEETKNEDPFKKFDRIRKQKEEKKKSKS